MNTMLRPPHSQDAPATPFRRAAGPLVALMLGASLLGSAQAKDAIRWQKPGWHFISRIMYQQDIQKNLKLRKNNISSQSLGMPEARLVTRYQHDDHWGFVFDIEPYVSLWRADGNPQENDTMLYLPQHVWAAGAPMTSAPGSSTPTSTVSTSPSNAVPGWSMPSSPSTMSGGTTCSTATPRTKRVTNWRPPWAPTGSTRITS